jgi:PAS domain S-box-containing protein
MRRRLTTSSKRQPERWVRFVYVLVLFVALALLATGFHAVSYSGSLPSVFPALVLVAFGAALGLIGRHLLLARRDQRQTANALDVTERKYKAVFDSTLDGILILDDQGTCLEANPAAMALLGHPSEGLEGRSIGTLLGSEEDFQAAWKRFLERTWEHAEARVLRADEKAVFVEYRARANFLPGRHLAVLRDITRKREAEIALRESERRFQQMADNIQEIFWMLDAEKMEVLYVNPACETIIGRSCRSLAEEVKCWEDVIHPEDRVRVLSRLKESVRAGQFDEEFRIVRPDNTTRWLWVRGFTVKSPVGITRRLVGTAQDVTLRKSAEEEISRHFDLAEAARAEAEAFRKTSLALTQNLSMDYVLDTLLQALLNLVPCESARVILVEDDTRLLLAGEVASCQADLRAGSPDTFDAGDHPLLMRILATKESLLIRDTAEVAGWASFEGFSHLRSWLCVPLIASQEVLGFLSLGDRTPQAFTHEHLRLAKSLAIPAAVGIQNARLYERAEIFRCELEQRLADLERAEKALEEVRRGRELS